MNRCSDIEKNLPAYLEDDITLQEKKLIGEHLETCTDCRKTLEGLKKTRDLVRSLEEIEPPPWFKQKIMARVREEAAEKKGIFRKLFFPMHIKIPIEVFATCLVVVMALYVFKTTGPEIKSLQTPSETTQTADYPYKQDKQNVQPVPAPAAKGKKIHEEHYKKNRAPAPQVLKEATGTITPGETLPAAPQPVPVLSAPALPVPARSDKEQKIEREREVFQAAPPSAGAPEFARKKKGDIAAPDGELQYWPGRKSASIEPQLKASAAKRQQTITMTVKTENTTIACKNIEDMLNRLNAVNLKRESQKSIESITAKLTTQQLKELYNKLKTIGEVKENIILYNISEEEVTVRIEIVNMSENP